MVDTHYFGMLTLKYLIRPALHLSIFIVEKKCKQFTTFDSLVFSFPENDAFRLLPLAEEYQMKQIIKASESTLNNSFFRMRKGRRPGSLPLDTTLQHLIVADRYKYTDLTGMCIDECIANESPNVIRAITECTELSEPIKVGTLKGKLDKVSLALAKERRDKAERENANSVGQRTRRK